MYTSILGILQGLIERDLLYIPGSDGKRLAICSQQCTEGSLCSLPGHNSPANLSALLALKQRARTEIFFVGDA